MKKIILIVFMLPLAGLTGFRSTPSRFTDSVDIRTGEWPMILEKSVDRKGLSYSLQFRDQGSLRGVVMDTLVFGDLQQLKYFDQALSALQKGHNGDVAKFSTYTIGRADKKGQGIWYVLRDKYGLADFQQPEADMINKTVRSW